jgi:hypothetical protein
VPTPDFGRQSRREALDIGLWGDRWQQDLVDRARQARISKPKNSTHRSTTGRTPTPIDRSLTVGPWPTVKRRPAGRGCVTGRLFQHERIFDMDSNAELRSIAARQAVEVRHLRETVNRWQELAGGLVHDEVERLRVEITRLRAENADLFDEAALMRDALQTIVSHPDEDAVKIACDALGQTRRRYGITV